MLLYIDYNMPKQLLEINEDFSLEYNPSNCKAMSYTIKRIKSPKLVTKEDYNKILTELANKPRVLEVYEPYFEYDASGVLHAHGIMVVFTNCWISGLKFLGYSVKYDDIYDLDGWQEYILKQQEVIVEREFPNRFLEEVDNSVYMFDK